MRTSVLRPLKRTYAVITTRSGAPINRWEHVYANEDGVWEEDFDWIQMKRMPQPFPKKHEVYGHKGLPPSLYPAHMNDVRYNMLVNNWPRRHFVPDNRQRLHNFSDLDEIMHGNQWNEYDLDYQLADPMESNHYEQGRSPMFLFGVTATLLVFIIIYPIYGYGIFDTFEDPIGWRKRFHHPMAGVTISRLGTGADVGDNAGLPKTKRMLNREDEPIRVDAAGKPLPNSIRRYPFADEYTYRI